MVQFTQSFKSYSPNTPHPEVENPNEPLWNGVLLFLGIAAIGVAALFIVLCQALRY